MYYCLTSHPKTQWLKTKPFIISHDFVVQLDGSMAGLARLTQEAAFQGLLTGSVSRRMILDLGVVSLTPMLGTEQIKIWFKNKKEEAAFNRWVGQSWKVLRQPCLAGIAGRLQPLFFHGVNFFTWHRDSSGVSPNASMFNQASACVSIMSHWPSKSEGQAQGQCGRTLLKG